MYFNFLGSSFRKKSTIVRFALVVLLFFYIFFLISTKFAWGKKFFLLLMLNPSLNINEPNVWQILTYVLLHDLSGPLHLAFNFFVIYFVGDILEKSWGSLRFSLFIVFAAALGGIFSCFFSLANYPVIGFSGISFALIISWGMIFFNNYVYFLGLFPVQGKYLILAVIIFEVFYSGSNKVSTSTHLGSIVTSVILESKTWRPLKTFRLFIKFAANCCKKQKE